MIAGALGVRMQRSEERERHDRELLEAARAEKTAAKEKERTEVVTKKASVVVTVAEQRMERAPPSETIAVDMGAAFRDGIVSSGAWGDSDDEDHT